MNDDSTQPRRTRRGRELKKILLEALLVGGIGGALSFAGNLFSPRGLRLTRNYFPGGTNGRVAAPVMAAPNTASGAATNIARLSPSVLEQIKEKGLQPTNLRQVQQLFHDPRYLQQLIVFVDARNEADYRKGHIPGAYELDPYRPEQQLGTVLPACLAAQKVVVYCTGGDCEDSQFAAILLRNAGVANQKLLVYAAGFSQWMSNSLPVEVGARDSGDIRSAPGRRPADDGGSGKP